MNIPDETTSFLYNEVPMQIKNIRRLRATENGSEPERRTFSPSIYLFTRSIHTYSYFLVLHDAGIGIALPDIST